MKYDSRYSIENTVLKGASHEGPHVVRVHLREMSRADGSAESRLCLQGVSVCSGCRNAGHRWGVLKQQKCIVSDLEAGSQRAGVKRVSFTPKPLSLACQWPSFSLSVCLCPNLFLRR